MKTRFLPSCAFFLSQVQSSRSGLEILEQRIAPAAVLSFIDLDSFGDASGAASPITVQSDDASVSVAVAPPSVTENGGAGLVYTFTRTGDTAAALSVNFTVGGTATLTGDYTAASAAADFTFGTGNGTITIAAGQTSGTVTLGAENDTLVEGSETTVLGVAPGAGYTPNPALATSTITDNDFATLAFTSPTSTVNEATAMQDVGVALLITANGTAGSGSLAREVTNDVENLLTGSATASGGANDYTFPPRSQSVRLWECTLGETLFRRCGWSGDIPDH
ncbi:MAG TPA: hypothetical protein VGO90_01440 [Chthoniobacteraceae bacterium]|nr:hypothetical protein [Chthoniobacteraceae bacterium]